MEGIKPVVAEEIVCDFRDVSIMIAFFGNVEPTGLCSRAQNYDFSSEYSCTLIGFLIEA